MTRAQEPRGKPNRRVALAASASVVLSVATLAGATHDVTHRYVIVGYVRDAAGQPITGAVVHVVREKTGFAYTAQADADGFYVVVAHLHDEDLLDALRVTAGRATVRIDARFNPVNSRSPRGTRIDFSGRSAVERQETFIETIDAYATT